MTQAVADYQDGVKLTDGSVTTSGFRLLGGKYGILVTATFGGGSVTLQGLAADASTYVTVATAITAAGYATADLPAGTYRLAIATATAVYCTVTPVPIRSFL